MVTEKNKISCPACEYERNSHGQPVEKNGQMQCLDCGSTWRVFGTASNLSSETLKNVKKKNQVKQLAEQVSFKVHELEPSAISKLNLKDYKPGLGIIISCFAIFILFAGIFTGVQMLKPQQQVFVSDQLNISEIEIEEQVRRNGQKIFTVTGLVSNPTSDSKSVPPIAIILRQKNGDEITRWYYNSSLVALLPGRKSRFASSIQYDTPIVAYAEAVFK